MLIVAVLPSVLFPPKKPVGRTGDGRIARRRPHPRTGVRCHPARPSVSPPVPPSARAPAETVWVTSPLYRLGFTTRGGALVRAELLAYRSFAKADSGRPVQLVRDGAPLLVYRRSGGGGDTTLLSDWNLTPSATRLQVGRRVRPRSRSPARETARGLRSSTVSSRPTIVLPCGAHGGIRSRRLHGAARAGGRAAVGRGGLDGRFPALQRSHQVDEDAAHGLRVGQARERKILDGPFEWAGVKSKYFFIAALAVEDNSRGSAGRSSRAARARRRLRPCSAARRSRRGPL